MKKIILSALLVPMSLIGYTQVSVPSNINVQEIQKEFMRLYKKRADSLHHEIAEDQSLLCLTLCQLNYLKDKEDISHEQESGSVLESLGDRFKYYYPEMEAKYNPELYLSEVISKISGEKILFRYTNREFAARLFRNFMHSQSHREIMDSKELVKVNFQVAITEHDDLVIVGVLASQTLE